MYRHLFFSIIFLLISCFSLYGQKPNILLIIADDMGVDALNGYHGEGTFPTTPTLDSLRATGITFTNVFSAPKCTPSRAAILSGKYGIKTGVQGTPGNLDLEHTSLFRALEASPGEAYSDAVIGKWHVSQPVNNFHPINHGADYFMGLMSASPSDYYAWEKTENGETTIENTYMTTALTDASIDWINDQDDNPWFLWLAHSAPHSPFHDPPDHLYTISSTQNNFRKYLAMIESLDAELNRLIYSIPEAVRENTLVIFVGDNGTPGNLLQGYPDGHGKSTVYQGGVRVPMIISGKGVSRSGEREDALIHFTDIYATILEVAGIDLNGGIYNSLSFDHILNNDEGHTRDYNFTEFREGDFETWAIRDNNYKLIEVLDGNQEFYDMVNDSFEINSLLDMGLSTEQEIIKADLEQEAEQIRTAWSCRDYIQNGDEEGIDCGGSFCSPCITATEDSDIETANIYPNPTSNHLTINSNSEKIMDLRLMNSSGQVILISSNINSGQLIVDLHSFEKGLYIIEVVLESHSEFKKLILQ